MFREVAAARPNARYVYVADDAGFPYGNQAEDALVARIVDVLGRAIDEHAPDLIVVACNTASTLALAQLRARFALPFVGTVPAIKPACAQSKSRRVTVLGTQATVSREYTRALIREFAGGCDVALVGSPKLAGFAEAELAGAPVGDSEIESEIAACFVDGGARRTDIVVLACTHYPLLTARFRAVAPWPVEWLDPRRRSRAASPISCACGRPPHRLYSQKSSSPPAVRPPRRSPLPCAATASSLNSHAARLRARRARSCRRRHRG